LQPLARMGEGREGQREGAQQRAQKVARPHWVLHVPVLMSGGVKRLLAATLNSSCPCGTGWEIQYWMSWALGSWALAMTWPPPCSTPLSSGLLSRRLSLGEPITVSPWAE